MLKLSGKQVAENSLYFVRKAFFIYLLKMEEKIILTLPSWEGHQKCFEITTASRGRCGGKYRGGWDMIRGASQLYPIWGSGDSCAVTGFGSVAVISSKDPALTHCNVGYVIVGLPGQPDFGSL